MGKFKKVLTSVLVVTLSLGLLAGCTATNKDGTTSEKPVEIIWWMYGNEPKDLSKVLPKINEYTKEKINVTLKLKYAGLADFTEKMSKIVSSGEAYDITFTCSWANHFSPNARGGAFMPLDELIASEGKDLKTIIPEQLWESAKIDGKIYGVPSYKDSTFAPYYVFNKNDLDALDLKAEDYNTMEKLEGALAAYKKANPDKYPFIFTASESYHGFFDEFDMLLGNDYPIGISLTGTTTTVVNPFESDLLKGKWDLLNSWYNKGYINADCTTLQESPKVKFLFGGHGFPYADVTAWSNDYPAIAVLRYDPYYTTGSTQGALNAISVNSKNPKEAIKVLTLVNTDEKLRNMLAYGLEGENYKKTGERSVEKLNKNWDVAQFGQGTFFNMYTVDPAPKDQWDAVKAQNESAKSSPILGFSFDTTKIDTELALVKAEFAKFKPIAMSGAKPRANVYDEMIKSLSTAGLDKVIAEAQRQIDEWKKTK